MRAKELVPILAERFGIAAETGVVIDRALAVAELRRRGKGRSFPTMTRAEAVTFLLACMITERPTRAAEDVRPWILAKVKVEAPLQFADRTGVTKDKQKLHLESLTPYEERPEVVFFRRIESFLAQKQDTSGRIGLVVLLCLVCDLLEMQIMRPEKINFDVIRSLGTARLTYTEEYETVLNLTVSIDTAGRPPGVRCEAAITATSSVSGYAFMEIMARTTD